MKYQRRKRGLTFVELVVSVLIISFMGLVIYSVFSNSVQIWNRVRVHRPESEVELFFEQITQDLKNVTPVAWGHMIGKKNSLAFYTLAYSAQTKSVNEKGHRTVLRTPVLVEYAFDKTHKSMQRKQVNYLELLNENKEAFAQRSWRIKVLDFSLEYYYHNLKSDNRIWQNKWQEEVCFPSALKISMQIETPTHSKIFLKFIPIYMGGCVA